MKKLKLKNYFLVPQPQREIESLQGWLIRQDLQGKDSRCRSRFIKLLGDRATEVDKEVNKTFKKYAKKKEVKEKGKDGKKKKVEKVIYLDEDGKETTDPQKGKRFKLENVEEMDKEMQEYLDEDLIIDVTPSTNKTIYGTRDIILNTNESFSGLPATRYDEWASAFEDIK